MRSRAASCCSWRPGGYAGILKRPGAAPSLPSRKRQVKIDVEKLRQRAREHLELGAVTPGYRADRAQIGRLLEGMPAVAEQHAEALARLLEGLGEPCEEQIDRALDEALEETFPASDPPAAIVPAPRCSS